MTELVSRRGSNRNVGCLQELERDWAVRHSNTDEASLGGDHARDQLKVSPDDDGQWAWPVLACQRLKDAQYHLHVLLLLVDQRKRLLDRIHVNDQRISQRASLGREDGHASVWVKRVGTKSVHSLGRHPNELALLEQGGALLDRIWANL